MKGAFDHERLDVYQLQLRFVSWAARLSRDVRDDPASRASHILHHLDRAALSVLLNIAEGNGKRPRPTRGRFFDDARGSATECAACLDALVATGASARDRVLEGEEMLVRVVSMLTKLVQRYAHAFRAREGAGEYDLGGSVADEDDGEDGEGEGEDDDEDEGEDEDGEDEGEDGGEDEEA